MLVIRYTSPDDLELEGDTRSLRHLKEAVLALTAAFSSLEVTADTNHTADPYQRCLLGLRIRASGGPTRVSISGETLQVAGSPENLARFATFLDVTPGGHAHYEYFSGNQYVAQDSVPLVVSAMPD